MEADLTRRLREVTPDRRIPAAAAARHGTKRQSVWSQARSMAAVFAAARRKELHRVDGSLTVIGLSLPCHRMEAHLPISRIGGAGFVWSWSLRRQRLQPHWSLPQHVLCMSGCSRRLHSVCHQDGLTFAFVRRFSCEHAVKCRWKLWSSSVRCTPCALARSARSTRATREIALASHSRRSRSWYQNACAVQPKRARSVLR